VPSQPEHWLRGPVDGVPASLQPIAHGLLQARDEAAAAVADFPPEKLWARPSGVASVGFHLLHLTGVVDRLFTYARGETLTAEQKAALADEGREHPARSASELAAAFHRQVDRALDQLRATDETKLADTRGVGRAQLPSTVLGLLAHAAEHAQRHVGQLLVTARIQRL